MTLVWLVGVTLAALAALSLIAASPRFPLPPPEAFEESSDYQTWRLVSVEFSKDGAQLATIRLVHPQGSVVAVLHYRLMSSTVFDAPVERSR